MIDKKPEITKQEIPSIINKHMPDYPTQSIQIESMLGMTNLTLKASAPGLNSLIFRLFGGEQIDRKRDNIIMHELGDQGVGPKCFYSCDQYRIQQFFDGGSHPPGRQIFKDNELMKIISERLSEFHKTTMPQTISKTLFFDEFFSEQNIVKLRNLKKKEQEDQNQFDELKAKFLEILDEIKQFYFKNFKGREQLIRFCHNDINNLNILIFQNQKVSLIDFEYSGYNYFPFDIANLLNQFCFDYIQEQPGFVLERKLSKDILKRAASCYPETYEGLDEDYLKMLIIANFYWGWWSLSINRAKSHPVFLPLKHGATRIELVNYYLNLLNNP